MINLLRDCYQAKLIKLKKYYETLKFSNKCHIISNGDDDMSRNAKINQLREMFENQEADIFEHVDVVVIRLPAQPNQKFTSACRLMKNGIAKLTFSRRFFFKSYVSHKILC
jgi:hypothetical protein